MSWNLNSYYTFISLAGIPDATAFNQLLKKFAVSILPDLLANDDHDLWCAFDSIREELEEAADEAEALEAMVGELPDYFSDFTYQDGGVSFLLGSECDTDADCDDLVDAVATFLLPYATDPYLVLSSAAFDRGGGYAHQFLLYRSGDSLVRESVTEFLERLRSNPTEQVGTLLPFVPVSTAEKVLVPMTE